MKDTSTAHKYAQALFSQAVAQNELRACQQGLEEIVRVAKIKSGVIQGVSHPFIAPEKKKELVHSVLGEYATPLLERFFLLLVERRRFGLLLAIEKEFQDLVDRHEKIEPVQVRSAVALTPSQLKTFTQTLEKWLGSSVRVETQVDPSLVGGFVIQTRDHIVDQSLKGQLQRLKQTLAA